MAVYAHINTVPHGSTGNIMMAEHRDLLAGGESSYAIWGRGRNPQSIWEYRFASDFEVNFDALQTRIDGKAGFHSKRATKRLLTRLDEIKPDIVHLHNLHGYYVNIDMLFTWLSLQNCKVEWTLHDCWAFTGHCSHFTYAQCEQWKSFCANSERCPQLTAYPKTYAGAESCRWCFQRKRDLFSLLSVDRMKLIVPSKWLAELLNDSFMSKYPVVVRPNSIDKDVFHPTQGDFRERLHVGNRVMVLGVANVWTERKGYSDFLRLVDALDSEHYAIVLVGLSKPQINELPAGVIGLQRTDSARNLAEIYSAADIFFNPTQEDNYPTVNLESEACGTPVVTYDTGGCRETIRNANSQVVSGFQEALTIIRSMSRA